MEALTQSNKFVITKILKQFNLSVETELGNSFMNKEQNQGKECKLIRGLRITLLSCQMLIERMLLMD